MSRKPLLLILLALLLGTFSLASKVEKVEASGTIYIRADGSIDPPTSNIATSDFVTYTFTGSNYDSIVVQRSNITIDGNGYLLQGAGGSSSTGINISAINNVTIKNMNIDDFSQGIFSNPTSLSVISGNNITDNYIGINLYYSSHNSISENYIANNSGIGIYVYSGSDSSISGNNVTANHGDGIYLESSSRNTLIENGIISNNEAGIHFFSSSNNGILGNFIITNNYSGLWLDSSLHNNISGNQVISNGDGVRFYSSLNNTIYHNNFIDNSNQAYVVVGLPNVWDNDFEGNYWRDCNGTDVDHDGISDTPYVIDADNVDHYPLMGTFQSFNVSNYNKSPIEFKEVDIISNSTIGQVYLSWADDARNPPTYMDWFLVLSGFAGQNGTVGFCRMTLPNDIINSTSYHFGTFAQLANDSLTLSKILSSNGTYTTLYFTYEVPNPPPFPEFEIIIIPEFPSFLILPLFFIVTLLAVIVYRKKYAKISGSP